MIDLVRQQNRQIINLTSVQEAGHQFSVNLRLKVHAQRVYSIRLGINGLSKRKKCRNWKTGRGEEYLKRQHRAPFLVE